MRAVPRSLVLLLPLLAACPRPSTPLSSAAAASGEPGCLGVSPAGDLAYVIADEVREERVRTAFTIGPGGERAGKLEEVELARCPVEGPCVAAPDAVAHAVAVARDAGLLPCAGGVHGERHLATARGATVTVFADKGGFFASVNGGPRQTVSTDADAAEGAPWSVAGAYASPDAPALIVRLRSVLGDDRYVLLDGDELGLRRCTCGPAAAPPPSTAASVKLPAWENIASRAPCAGMLRSGAGALLILEDAALGAGPALTRAVWLDAVTATARTAVTLSLAPGRGKPEIDAGDAAVIPADLIACERVDPAAPLPFAGERLNLTTRAGRVWLEGGKRPPRWLATFAPAEGGTVERLLNVYRVGESPALFLRLGAQGDWGVHERGVPVGPAALGMCECE